MVGLPTIGVQFGKLPHHSESPTRTGYGIRLTQAQFFLQRSRYKLLEGLAAARSRSLCPPEQGLGHLQSGFRGAHGRFLHCQPASAIMTHKYGYGQNAAHKQPQSICRLNVASLRRGSSNQLFETLEEWNDYLER
jgi:hypothetical protein